ncbi:hypothetical protein RF55_10205 [Lasius niger]|uniref:Uncharacterized protein n=1 Tax=Lasius niger TaxID=67767 RepID=A0A0J7KIK6_LASNI|nr:hypothetical protein RF55_10205 [Lasius niger]
MHYLKTSVKGDAEQLIRNLPSTENNFERAWTTLREHLENKRLLVRSYLAAFTSIPRMKADSVADLRRIFHGVVSTVGALEGIDRPISDGTDLFVHLVVELLDAKTRREWENSLGKSSEPLSYEALREFLQEQLMTKKVLRAVTEKASAKSSEKSSRSVRANHAKSRGADSSRSCPLCKKEHFMAFCEQYRKKSAQERREVVNTHQRCWNCLGRHMVDDYLARGHMSRVPEKLAASSGPVCYLPHHGVLKDIGADAKIRVMFNGSSRTAARTSLNDALHTGPNLLPVLADVMMR